MFVSDHFHLLGIRKTRESISSRKIGLDLWKWPRAKEASKVETAFRKKWDMNNLDSKFLNQYWTSFFSLLGSRHHFIACCAPFRSKKRHRKNVKFLLTRYWLELANQWLDSFCDSTLTRLEKISDDSDSKGLWLWLDSTKMTWVHHCSEVMMTFFWKF